MSKIWNKANLITFLGIVLSVIGIEMCFLQKQNIAIILLMGAGICDAFDGTFAKKVNKSKNENNKYGIELDSLADVFSSGLFPVIICLSLGGNSIISMIIYILFISCGITRLAYFNIENYKSEYFTGLPITFSTIAIPFVYLTARNEIAFTSCLGILSLLFVVNTRIKKPGIYLKITLTILAVISAIIIILKGIL